MKCRICGNEKDNQTYEAREMMFGYRDVFRYFQCSRCKCLQIEDFPFNLSKYYPDNYYSYKAKSHRKKRLFTKLRDGYALFDKGFMGKVLCAKYLRKELRFLSLLPVRKDTKILDVGCGAGNLLYSMRELGMKNLLGIDPFNAEDVEYENGLKIQKKEIHDVKDLWDIVMFHHSFEHIADPAKTLQTVSDLLTPDGCCVIRIPISSSYAWNHYKVNWVQLDAPRHYFLHSLESMNILADQARLTLSEVVYDSSPFQFWASEQYIKDIPLADKRSYSQNRKTSGISKKEISVFRKQAKELNDTKQGDQAAFYFKKRA